MTATPIPTHHMAPGSDELRRAAEAILATQDVQWTDLRALVFHILSAAPEPLTAYAIAEQVSDAAGRRVAANSVYRILDLFVTHNLATRVESRNAFVVNLHPACQHDCIFLVCDHCNRIEHLDDDRLAGAMREQARATGFRPRRAILELVGQCARCQQTGDRQQADDHPVPGQEALP